MIPTYLRLPFHANSADQDHDKNGDDADDSSVVDATVDDFKAVLFEKVIQRIAETYRIEGGGHGVGEGQNEAHRRPKFRSQRSGDDVVHTA